MKKLLALTTLIFALVFTTEANAQKFDGLDKSPADIAAYPAGGRNTNKSIKVIYSRPQLKGRSLAELAPAGKVWRTGANEATEITFYKDAKIGDTTIKAGTYTLFTIPGESEWTVILNKNLNQWGAYSYEESADVTRVKAKASTASDSLEAFSMTFEEANGAVNLVMGWGKTRVTLPITI